MKRLLIALAVIIALIGVGTGAVLLTRPSQKPVQAQIVEEPLSIQEIHRLVNIERVKAGQEPFILDERLSKGAQEKADEITIENGWDEDPHHNKDGVSGTLYSHKYAPECKYISENLSSGQATSNNVVNITGWMSSKAHHDAMLSLNYKIVGYGVSGRFVVQHMC